MSTKERPILFSGPMVRAILDGRKTQTRRVLTVKHAKRLGLDTCGDLLVTADGPQWDGTFEGGRVPWCPYGRPGDRLWVRETHATVKQGIVAYREGGEAGAWCDNGDGGRMWIRHGHVLESPGYPFGLSELKTLGIGLFGGKWKPSIFMPRWASRITLEIASVRVERLQEISEADAIAEGVTPIARPLDDPGDCWTDGTHRTAYRYLWNEINGWLPNSWAANPFVWVIEFRRVQE